MSFGIYHCVVEYVPTVLEVNRAYLKHTWQYENTDAYNSSFAVDGDLNPNDKFCASTGYIDHPWFAVDLEASYQLWRVNILGRESDGRLIYAIKPLI